LPAPEVALTGAALGVFSWHNQVEGQSASVAHVAAAALHHPGKAVVVVHMSGCDAPTSNGASEAVALPVPPELPDTPEPPEQVPDTDGWHTKPLPQSTSALQGSCHLKAHVEEVVVVQVGGVTSTGSHFVFGGQGATDPPEHAEMVSVWHTMSVPQSLSVVQGPGSHVERVTETPVLPPAPPDPLTSVVLQSVSGAHVAGVEETGAANGWQMNPCAQSVSPTQLEGVVANARPAKPAELIITNARRGFLIDMVDLSRWERWV